MNPAQSLAIEQTRNAQEIGSLLMLAFVAVVFAVLLIRNYLRR